MRLLVDGLGSRGVGVVAPRGASGGPTATRAAAEAAAGAFGAAAETAGDAEDDGEDDERADDDCDDDGPSEILVSRRTWEKAIDGGDVSGDGMVGEGNTYLQYAFCMQLSQPENVCLTPLTSLETSRVVSEALIARAISDRGRIIVGILGRLGQLCERAPFFGIPLQSVTAEDIVVLFYAPQ